jgi:tetratricopeptide (TPR) repeat protein/TolB-like protein
MASGRVPFDNTTTLQERLTRRPPPLKHPWARIVARCLEPDPSRRCLTVSEVASALVPFPALRWTAIAAAVVVAAVAGAIGYRTVGVSHETVRLAVMPFATDPDSKSLSDGLLQDTADRLRRVKDDRRKLTIIPPRDTVRNKVDATHTLSGTLRRDNGGVAVHAVLTDARSQVKLKEWDAQYKPDALSSMPVALAGIVTGTLRLKPLASTATVNASAYPDFAAGLGLLQRDSGVDAALPFLARAVAADPDSPLTHARLAEAQARKYRLSFDSTWLDKARQSLHDATQRNPDLPLVWLVSGRINEYTGFYEQAESDLQRALQIDPGDGDAWRRLGQVYQENYRFPEAVVAFKKAIDTQPDYFSNHQDLCELYTQQANYVEAIRECRKMVQLAPDFSDAHYALAAPYLESGDFVQSKSEFLLAIKLDPMSVKAVSGLGFALNSQGRWKEAIPLFYRAIEIGPATHWLYSDLGTAYRLAGQPAESRKAYRVALDLAEKELDNNPRDAILKAQLAYLCARLDERSRANSEALQARQLAPASVEVAWWLVLTWDALGERDEAINVLQHVPDDILRRITREKELADLRQSFRFRQLMASRNIQ